MPRTLDRLLWPLLALASALAVTASLGLTAWLDLNPCHLCIFQRLLFMVLTALALLALPRHRLALVAAGLFVVVCAVGIGTAAWQSWLQLQPPGSVTCLGADMGPIERLVEWLGLRWPDLFMASGFCEDKELVILGLSLANWAVVAYSAALAAALRASWLRLRRG